MSRWAFNRRDNNHTEIVEAFRSTGCGVMDCAALKDGAPDLVVSCAGVNRLVEIKGPKGKVRPEQKAWAAGWKSPVFVCRSVDTALEMVSAWRCGYERTFEVIGGE